MRVDPKDGTCRNCGGELTIIAIDDATITVECINCGDCYPVEPDAYDLIPDQLAQHIPPLYATEKHDDPTAHIKLFSPFSSWTWYLTEFDPKQRLCFGLVFGHERELGNFSLDELAAIRGPGGLRIERDLHWEPRPLSQCEDPTGRL